MELRKIPLGSFIEILQGLYEEGVNFIDLSSSVNNDGESVRDSVKITVKPEYLEEVEDEQEIDEEDLQELNREIKLEVDEDESSSLSEDDINELI